MPAKKKATPREYVSGSSVLIDGAGPIGLTKSKKGGSPKKSMPKHNKNSKPERKITAKKAKAARKTTAKKATVTRKTTAKKATGVRFYTEVNPAFFQGTVVESDVAQP